MKLSDFGNDQVTELNFDELLDFGGGYDSIREIGHKIIDWMFS